MKSLAEFIFEAQSTPTKNGNQQETYELYNPIDEQTLNFIKKQSAFSKISSMNLCSVDDSTDGYEIDPESFEDNAAYEIFSKVCDVDSNVKDPDYINQFKKIDVKDKLLTTYRGAYLGAISGKADGKEFIVVFKFDGSRIDADYRDYKPFANFDREINKIKKYDDETMCMASVALYM